MADWFRRIKAALTPQVLLLLLLALSMIGYCALREEAGGAARRDTQASGGARGGDDYDPKSADGRDGADERRNGRRSAVRRDGRGAGRGRSAGADAA